MVPGSWKLNPAFLELGKLADQKVANVGGRFAFDKGTATSEVMMTLVIINSLHWVEGQLIYPEASHFEEGDWSPQQAEALSKIVMENITLEWVEKNIKTTVYPNIPWGGMPYKIHDTAKKYLQHGVDGDNLKIVSQEGDDLIYDPESQFSYPSYGFIHIKVPQSINKRVVL